MTFRIWFDEWGIIHGTLVTSTQDNSIIIIVMFVNYYNCNCNYPGHWVYMLHPHMTVHKLHSLGSISAMRHFTSAHMPIKPHWHSHPTGYTFNTRVDSSKLMSWDPNHEPCDSQCNVLQGFNITPSQTLITRRAMHLTFNIFKRCL